MASKNPQKPNVLFILTDDQGPWALGCAGNREIQTPHLDRMAAEGTRFENFFCTSPVCSPARASLLTGTIPSVHGVQDWIRQGNAAVEGDSAIEYLSGLTGYTDILSSQGYNCGLSGKWHLGDSARPQKGFAHWYAHLKGSDHYYTAPMFRNGALVHEPGYISDLITDDAINFIHSHIDDDRPFYSSVHFTAPHSPWARNEHPEEIVSLYDDCPFETCPQEGHHPEATLRMNREDAFECLRGYFAAVTAMDRNVGRLLDTLDEAGLRESTLVCFLSDNGFNCGHHGIWGKGNGTLTLNMFDTSVKVPAIFMQPGRVPKGVVQSGLVSGYDFMPTLIDYLGIDVPLDPTLPGRSFAALLKDNDARKDVDRDRIDKGDSGRDNHNPAGGRGGNRDHVVIFDEYGPVRMVRTEEWKYVHRYQFGPHELYNIKEDPGEEVNRYPEMKNRPLVTSLRLLLEEWFFTHVDPRVDAVREPVTGNGQIARPGLFSGGQLSFMQDRKVTTDPHYDPGMVKKKEKKNA